MKTELSKIQIALQHTRFRVESLIPKSIAAPIFARDPIEGGRLKRAITTLLKLLLAGGLIYWMLASGKLDLTALFQLVTIPKSMALMGLMLLILLNNNWRWKILLHAFDMKLGFLHTFKLTLIGMFFNFAMPGGVGGDVVKGYYLLKKQPDKRTRAAVTILVDRVIGMLAMALFALVAMLVQWSTVEKSPQLQNLFLSVLVVNFGIAVFFGLVLSRRVFAMGAIKRFLEVFPAGASLRKLQEALFDYRQKKMVLVASVAISSVTQVLNILFFYVAAQFMGYQNVELNTFLYVIPLGLIAMAIPLGPGGVGVGQAAFLVLFTIATGVSSQIGPNTVTAFQVISFIWGLIGAILYFRMKSENPGQVPK